eukprot:993059-Heterocapsa_arctica.AAC.1
MTGIRSCHHAVSSFRCNSETDYIYDTIFRQDPHADYWQHTRGWAITAAIGPGQERSPTSLTTDGHQHMLCDDLARPRRASQKSVRTVAILAQGRPRSGWW